jgi:hypothetical protein
MSMSTTFKSLMAATLLGGVCVLAGAQTAASGTVQGVSTATPLSAAKTPAAAGAKKPSKLAVKKKSMPAKTVVAKKQASKKKPHVKLGTARKHAASPKKA